MPKGIEQARKTAEYIAQKCAPEKIYSSDLKRAYCTAVPISELIGADIITDQGIREIYAGKWQKMTFNDLEKTFPYEYNVWLKDIGNACCSGGESVKKLSERVMASLTAIAKENDGKTVCISTHATPARQPLKGDKGDIILTYKVVDEGKYHIWMRYRGLDGGSDSCYIKINDGEWMEKHLSSGNYLWTCLTAGTSAVSIILRRIHM